MLYKCPTFRLFNVFFMNAVFTFIKAKMVCEAIQWDKTQNWITTALSVFNSFHTYMSKHLKPVVLLPLCFSKLNIPGNVLFSPHRQFTQFWHWPVIKTVHVKEANIKRVWYVHAFLCFLFLMVKLSSENKNVYIQTLCCINVKNRPFWNVFLK